MPVDIVISTDQNRYNTTGSITASASSYDSAVPTTTAPSTTAQSFVLPNNPGDKPSLLRLTPFHSTNSATSLGIRVVGWSVYTQTNGTALYVPNVLADLTPAYNATVGSIPSVAINGTTQYFFHSIVAASGVPVPNVYSPGTAAASGTPAAHVLIDMIGHQYITLQFKSSTGTMGALFAFV